MDANSVLKRTGRSDEALRNRSRMSWRRHPARMRCSPSTGAARRGGSPASAARSEAVRADSPGRFREDMIREARRRGAPSVMPPGREIHPELTARSRKQ